MKVQAEQVEACLKPYFTTPFAVTSVPDPRLGEAVTLLYTDERTTDEVAHLCNEKLQPYWRPKHYYQVTDIPQTGSGKISRAEAHALAERLHKAFR